MSGCDLSQSPDWLKCVWRDRKMTVQWRSPSKLAELERICREQWKMPPNAGVQSSWRLLQVECSAVLKTQQSTVAKADGPVRPFIARFLLHHQVLIDHFLWISMTSCQWANLQTEFNFGKRIWDSFSALVVVLFATLWLKPDTLD